MTQYYGAAAWNDEAPFTGIGQTIQPRLKFSNRKDPFHDLEINPDIRTANVNVTFADIDKAITALFQQYQSGVACEFVLYYPDQSITTSIWHGQLQAPNEYGWTELKTQAINGSRSREQQVPFRGKPKECSAAIFGGLLPDADSRASNLCDYNPPGGVGLYKTGSTPFVDCPKDPAACIARFGNLLTYGGFNTNASPTISDYKHFFLAVSRGNASGLKEPIRVVFGTKNLRGLQLYQYRVEKINSETMYLDTVWEVCEGPVSELYNFRAGDKFINQMHLNFRLGTRRQVATFYAGDVSNYSHTAHIRARIGPIPSDTDPASVAAECIVKGFSEVCVYTSAVGPTKTRQWSDDRVWCLIELYKNQKWGLGYRESQFEIADWITASTWGLETVSQTITYPDGESTTLISRRTTMNAILEAKPVGEQVEDICRAGGLSVPFWHDGKLTIACFRAATSGELSAAKVFYDRGPNVNICWSGDNKGGSPGSGGGEPMIKLSQTPATKLVNEIEVRFEEAANNGTERPITVDDRNWKLIAGRQLGAGQFQAVPKHFIGTGIVALAEAVRFGYRMLKYGQFDEGGTDNNLRCVITIPFEQGLGIKRYEIIKIDSDILDEFTIGSGSLAETPQYFRVLSLKRISNGRMEITAQAYNHTSYSAFEVVSGTTPAGEQPIEVFGAGSYIADGLYDYVGQKNGRASFANGVNEIYWNSGSSMWRLEVDATLYYTGLGLTPDVASWSTAGSGVAPVPTVTKGHRRDAGGEEVTINSVTYNTTTGNLEVELN